MPRRHGERHSEHHGVKQSYMVDKRGEDGILSPICHRRTWKQATHRDSDEDSASADDGYLLSNPRIQARGNDDDDGMKELGVQFVEFIKLKSSPRSTSPRDKDGRGKRQERRAEESQERRERQSRWRDDSSADDGRRKHSLRKRQGSSESRRDRQGDKSADNRRDKSPVDGHGKRTTARRRLLNDDSSNHTPSPGRKSQLKMVKYDGTSCVETFLVKFDTCAEHNEWNAKDKAAHLKTSLTGGAGLQENKQHNNKNRINNLTNVNTLARYVLMQ